MPVHSASNETVFIKNLNFPCEILAKGGDRPSAESDSCEHQNQSTGPDDLFSGSYVSFMIKAHGHADHSD